MAHLGCYDPHEGHLLLPPVPYTGLYYTVSTVANPLLTGVAIHIPYPYPSPGSGGPSIHPQSDNDGLIPQIM